MKNGSQDDAEENPRFYAHAEKMLRDMEVGYHEDLLKDIWPWPAL